MDNISLRLSFEDKAHCWGYRNEVLNTLAADFIQGASFAAKRLAGIFPCLPDGIHIARPLRESFFEAGADISKARKSMTDDDLRHALAMTLERFVSSVKEAIAENGVMASTGDCRGACKYNTGDSSEYRNYGW